MTEKAEIQLAEALIEKQKMLEPYWSTGEFEKGLKTLAELQTDVDLFFEEVLVMSDDPAQQRNRLILLSQLRDLFLKTADISKLA